MAGMNAYEKPLLVEVFQGEVVISTSEGPFSASLTPGAAAKTAEILAEAAKSAVVSHASQDGVARD